MVYRYYTFCIYILYTCIPHPTFITYHLHALNVTVLTPFLIIYMALTAHHSVGIPTVALHDCEGLTITVETKDGTLYRGLCQETEDCMNIKLRNVMVTLTSGETRTLQAVYIPGSRVVFMSIPEILAEAPYMKRVEDLQAGNTVLRGVGWQRRESMRNSQPGGRRGGHGVGPSRGGRGGGST